MKKYVFFILLIITILSGCRNGGSKINRGNKYDVDTVYHTDKIKELEFNGLFEFKIGITTVRDCKRINDEMTFSDPFFKPNFYGSDKWEVHDTEKADRWAKNDLISKYDFTLYTVGDIKINSLSLAFYNDTLCAINVPSVDYDLLSLVIEKYGPGEGYEQSSGYKKGDKYYFDSRERREWKGRKATAEYYKSSSNEGPLGGYLVEYLTISDNSGRYELFEKELQTLKEEDKKIEEKDHQNMIDLL